MPAKGPRVRLAGWMLWLVAALPGCYKNTTIPPEPPASVRRGDEAFRYEQYSTAIDAYRNYIDQTEQGAYTARVMYKTALAEYRLTHYRATLSTLDDLSERYPKGHWVQVEALRGDAERALGNNMAALQDWEKAWKLANDRDRQKLRKRIVTTAQDLSDVDLARARRMATDQGFAALLDRQIAARQPPELGEPVPNAPESTLEPETEVASAPPPIVEEPTEPVETVQLKDVVNTARKIAPSPAVEVEPLPPADKPTWSPPQAAGPAPAADKPTWSPPQAAGSAPANADKPTWSPPQAAGPAPANADNTTWPPPQAAGPAPAKTLARGEGQIGCLLPLSGSARGLGERAMRGVRLVFGADDNRLVVADTEGSPQAAVRQFEDLAHNPTVLAVIGPVRGEDAQVVARRAEELHVPVLLLSPDDGVSGKFALPVGATRAEQITRLVDYAMGKFRLRRFGILYPKDAADVAATFRSAVERRGGGIVGALAYPPGADNLTSAAATVRGWRNRDNLQAVFLPDGAAVAAEFANFLQREMPDVTLLGVQEWESLANQHGNLNGVLFADRFYANSARPATRAFVERFQQTYHETPGLIEADAYDAAMLAESALAKGANSPASMSQVLRGLGPVNGAAGDMTMTPKGSLRTAFLLQVSEGRLEEVGEPYALPLAAGWEPAPVPPLATAPVAEAQPLPPQAEALPAEPVGAPASVPAARAQPGTTNDAHVKVACLLPLTGPDQAYG